MQGIDSEGGGGPEGRQPAPVLAAWIRELLGDVQSTQVRKLEQLRARLEGQIFSWDNSELARSLQALYSGGRELHFAELRTGWLQRMLGRHKPAFQRFAAAVDRMDGSVGGAKAQALALAASFKDHNQAARRVFVELDLECKELAAELDQGVTWLQQMCEDINGQRKGGAADRQLATLAEQAQAYTQDFKRLQSISALVRDIGVRGQAILDRRSALLEQVRAEMEFFEKQWSVKVGDLAAAVRAGHTGLPGIPKAIEAHDEAMKRLEAALDACGALQGEEQFMDEQLESLGETLREGRAA
ncbi:hypothetical protein [Ramlibacter sp. PS4R-6]|uniref:hypothetical protein n=1 Tax=Ramlibacter sp. PS4R-6 TaxID=3133438 RepID=UPI003095520C